MSLGIHGVRSLKSGISRSDKHSGMFAKKALALNENAKLVLTDLLAITAKVLL